MMPDAQHCAILMLNNYNEEGNSIAGRYMYRGNKRGERSRGPGKRNYRITRMEVTRRAKRWESR